MNMYEHVPKHVPVSHPDRDESLMTGAVARVDAPVATTHACSQEEAFSIVIYRSPQNDATR
jgi:hypothetical protein